MSYLRVALSVRSLWRRLVYECDPRLGGAEERLTLRSIVTWDVGRIGDISFRVVVRFLLGLHAGLLYLFIHHAAWVLNPVRPGMSSHYMWDPLELLKIIGMVLLSALLYAGAQFRELDSTRRLLKLQFLWAGYLCYWTWWDPSSRLAPSPWGWLLAMLTILFAVPHLARWEYWRVPHQAIHREVASEANTSDWYNKLLLVTTNSLAVCAISGAAFSFWLSTRDDFDWSEHETFRSVMAATFLCALLFFSVDAARGKRTMLPVGIATALIVGFL